MKQRGFILTAQLIAYAVIALVVVIAAGTVTYKVNHWCNAACTEARDEADTLRKEKVAAQERATALANLWAAQVDKTEAEARQRKVLQDEKFTALKNRVRHLSGNRALRLGAPAVGVLNDAVRAANDAPAVAEVGEAPAPGVPEPPDADNQPGALLLSEREMVDFIVATAIAYNDAVAQWKSCVNFYEGLRNTR